jgi:hypothetical protein
MYNPGATNCCERCVFGRGAHTCEIAVLESVRGNLEAISHRSETLAAVEEDDSCVVVPMLAADFAGKHRAEEETK